MAHLVSNLEKKPHRKEATHNGNKVRLFNCEFFLKIFFSGLLSGFPLKSLYFCTHFLTLSLGRLWSNNSKCENNLEGLF